VMDDLHLTKEFKEARAAISSDISNNPKKYKVAREWLDKYTNQQTVWSAIENKCKAILNSNFKREDRQEWPSLIMPDSDLKVCKILQAVAVVDMVFFPDLEHLISKYQEEANSIPSNFQPISERIATRAKIKRFIEKIYPTYQHQRELVPEYYGLYIACEELLGRKGALSLIGEDTKLKVCLLTWLIANPDAEKAEFTITEFQKTKWELTCGNDVIPHREKVIQLLKICDMLPQWQVLACTAITDKANIDGAEPKDLITLAVVMQNYQISRAQIKRDIADGTLKSYRKKPRSKHLVSRKEAGNLYTKS
ncbi:unnamed protein product, partial [marine sediment metagenome]